MSPGIVHTRVSATMVHVEGLPGALFLVAFRLLEGQAIDGVNLFNDKLQERLKQKTQDPLT